MIIATAGHVDHGKTTLLQAITGVNADRLPEEKKRGMTIDLGYAYWPQPDGRVPGFIDVPGHEKFLSNMLAGVGGIDHALLVVACDDGVMAQTREHLAILQLTGNPLSGEKQGYAATSKLNVICHAFYHKSVSGSTMQICLAK